MFDVINFLEKDINLDNQRIVIALSGGPDSMALLNILLSLRNKHNFEIIVAHVNHSLRVESEEEKVFVEKYCRDNNCIFEYLKIEKYNNDNFHNQSRIIRYEFFDKVMKKYKAKYLFTAHHGDDLIETILMRITRGSTLIGYSGFEKIIKKNDYYIVKPLIYVTKKQLLEYVEENNIPYRVDKSNEKDVYTRNRYRKYILPVLKEEDKNVHKKYLKFSEKLEQYSKFVDNIVNSIIKDIIIDNKIIISKINNQDDLIKEEIIRKYLKDNYNDDICLLNDNHIKDILSIISSNNPNISINLPLNKKITKSYDKLYFDYESSSDDYCILFDKEINLDGNIIKKVEKSDDKSNYTIRLNSKDITLPLYIRNIRVKDKIEVKNLNGTKKVKDIFIDNKIPVTIRKRIPILVDSNNNILWILGVKKSKYDKLKEENCDIIVRYILKKEESHEKEN